MCDDLSRYDDVTEFGCSRFTDADAAFQQALAVLQPEQLQQQSQQHMLDLRCRILLERGVMFIAASKISRQTFKVWNCI